jgi:hypothetical protein
LAPERGLEIDKSRPRGVDSPEGFAAGACACVRLDGAADLLAA